MKRTQIYLDEEQDRRLGRRAKAAGVTKSSLIRDAIDWFLGGPDDGERHVARFRSAVTEAAASGADLPPGREYVESLRRAERSREDALDARRQR